MGRSSSPGPGPTGSGRWSGRGRSSPATVRTLVARERTESAAEVDGAIDRLLADGGVDYVHVRSTSAGCFLCRLDPTPA